MFVWVFKACEVEALSWKGCGIYIGIYRPRVLTIKIKRKSDLLKMLAATVRSFSNSSILWSKSGMIAFSANPSHVCSELLPAQNPRGITCIQADGLLLLVCTVHLTYES